jgi:glycosyltransferase involved in cell wall biosynthesis
MLELSMSILMVMESVFPSPGGGGAESQVRTLGIELLKRGHGMQLVVPMVGGGPTAPHELLDGIPVTRIAYPKVARLGALLMLASLAWLLFRRRHQYQVIHAHIAGNMAAVCAVIGRLLGKPVLVKLTGMTELKGGILDPRPSRSVRLRRFWLRQASLFQATSQRIAGELAGRGFGLDKVLILPNGVNMRRFEGAGGDSALREQLCPGRSLVGVYVGRLEPEKGLEMMFEAWAGAYAGRPDTALVVVGSGSLQSSLADLAAARGIADQVRFVGPSSTVERYLAMADVGLLTSQFEGLSNSLLEYMAAGLPVVGSAVSGTEDWVVNGHTGWLFPAGDVRALEAALVDVGRVGSTELRRRGARAQQRIRSGASTEVVVQTLLDTYARLSGRHA